MTRPILSQAWVTLESAGIARSFGLGDRVAPYSHAHVYDVLMRSRSWIHMQEMLSKA